MATTPLSQAVMAGMDPGIYRPLSDIQQGNAMLEVGRDASPTTGLGALSRLANAIAGTYIANSSTSDLAKTIAGGKRSAAEQLMEALQSQRAAVPSAPPAVSPAPAPMVQQTNVAQPVAPEAGSPNAQVAERFPADWSSGSAASPLPNDAPSPLDTAAYPAGPVGAPTQVAGDASQPRGIRNNNPLNIEAGDFTKGQPGFVGSDGRFAKFETPEHGLAAAHKLLDVYDQKHGLNTVAGIVGRWAPQADGNNTMAYAADVAGRLGIDPNAPVPVAMRPQLIAAMAQHENGVPVPGADQTPYKVAGPAVAALSNPALADDAELPAAATATAGQQPITPATGGVDVHKLMAVLQNPYSDDATKALASKLLAAHLAPTEDTYGVTGEDPFGGKKYGFINAKEHTINGQAADAGTRGAQSAGPMDGIDSNKTGEDYLKQFPPEIQSGVKDYLEGRRMPTGNPRRSDIVKQVASKYGNDIGMPADDTSFAARRTMLTDLNKTTPGSIGGQITFARTSLNHLGEVAKAAEDLRNVDMGLTWGNTGINNLRALRPEQAAKVAALQDAAQHYGQEVTKFYAGSPGGEAERTRFLTALGAAKSPQELAAVVESERNLIPGRMSEVENRIKGTLGPLAEKYPVNSAESSASLKHIDSTVARMRGLKPSGETAAPAASSVERTIGDKTYVKRGDQWFEK